MGIHVALVASQIKALFWLPSSRLTCAHDQALQSLCEPRYRSEVSAWELDAWRAALSQHLPYTLLLLLLALPVLRHSLPEVLRTKHEAIEQEP